ncbi:MAG TPA: hypothetical protein VJ010_01685, partial [Actinomycetota bacterium]|nr:hypothetical protein [Actinomycetota bacterium]
IARGEGHVTSLRRTVLAEILVASGVLGVTGVLSGLVPAAYVSAQATAAAAQHVVVVGSDFATTVRVRLTVTPGTVGPNEFQARVTDYDTGRPAPATAVRLQFSLPSRPDLGSPTLPLTGGPGGLWTGQGTALALEGRWNVNVLIQEATGGLEVPLAVQTRLPPEKITVSRAPGQPTLYTIALSGGSSLQTYVDPARPGTNQVHFTFFQSSGQELPIASAQATGTAPGGAAGPLKLIRFDDGHFAANAALVAGNWRFQIQATSRDGQVFTAYFDQQIGS